MVGRFSAASEGAGLSRSAIDKIGFHSLAVNP
jgi:hypothetical protein